MIKQCVCLQACHGPLREEDPCLLEKRKAFQGTNALLLLLPPLLCAGQGQEEEDVTLLSAFLQLRQVQQASCWHSPLPLAVVVTDDEEDIISDQGLEEGNFNYNYMYYFIDAYDLVWLEMMCKPAVCFLCFTFVFVSLSQHSS